MDGYTAFVVSMKGTSFQFIRGVCSRSYLRDLVDRRVKSEPLRLLYRSGLYELLEQEDPREFVRIFRWALPVPV